MNYMSKYAFVTVLAAGAFTLSACAGGGLSNRKSPDEFAVTRQAPLVVPPDYALQPPRPGAPRPLAPDSQTQALEAMFGQGTKLPARSPVENQLLNDAKANNTDPSVRSTVDDTPSVDETTTVDKGAFLRELLDAPAGTRNAEIARVSVSG